MESYTGLALARHGHVHFHEAKTSSQLDKGTRYVCLATAGTISQFTIVVHAHTDDTKYSALSKPTDPWLSQLIRAERVCEQIAEQMEFYDATNYVDLSDATTRLKTQFCRNLILNFRITIPSRLRTPTLNFWEHLATAYMHEAVLHTATNKQSFAAPFVAENLSVSDFPAPADVTQDHITALFELTAAVQAMIDLYTSLDTETLTAMPGFLHSSRAAYALFILAKLFVATMAPGNTFGAVLDGNMTLVGEYA